MELEIRTMSEEQAEEVISWRYPGEYAFYDMERDVEDMAELRAAHVREEKYFSALKNSELIGFFEFEVDGDVVEVGLGLRPDLTGRGLGESFLREGLSFARERFAPERFRLRVAEFNVRAITLYERAGFAIDRRYGHDFYGTPYDFLEMSRPAVGTSPSDLSE
ncbi:MAG: GNAT family N-acetyltransferase [Actinomycetota bacterium]